MNIIDVGLKFGEMNMNNHPAMSIVHHLEAEGANWTVDMIHNMHITERGWAGIGYHYYIRIDGSVYKGRPDNAIGAHCQGCNTNTIGIAFEGNYDTRTEMPTAQFNAWCDLRAYLTSLYGNMPVFGHREKGSSECPGKNFPLEEIRVANFKSMNKQGWNLNPKGWWYCTDIVNGYYYKDVWKQIDNEWYSFDTQGYARCNCWIQDQGKWYWLRENCMMAKSQWLWIDGECYCFGKDGSLYIDCKTPDGYTVDKDGAWVH
jgi:hypothetical protein